MINSTVESKMRLFIIGIASSTLIDGPETRIASADSQDDGAKNDSRRSAFDCDTNTDQPAQMNTEDETAASHGNSSFETGSTSSSYNRDMDSIADPTASEAPLSEMFSDDGLEVFSEDASSSSAIHETEESSKMRSKSSTSSGSEGQNPFSLWCSKARDLLEAFDF